ncbi:aldo/keto reductase [Salinimicrobium gaetbulicola]|uniref:Aldo/keto reductase n=1 Tax=Salinimicrobium gaetbulicola TaxID=999702 RepID=A0ABW3IH46_9FLAO
MRQKKSYSRIIQGLTYWEHESYGDKIRLFQHSVERDMTSFLALGPNRETLTENSLGTALSESGLSRDEIQLLAGMTGVPNSPDDLVEQVEEILDHLKTDYLDLFFLDLKAPSEVTVPAIERLISQGKIHETGIYDDNFTSQPQQIKMEAVRANLTDWKITPASMKTLTLKMASSEDLTEMVWIHLMEIDQFGKKLDEISSKYELSGRELVLAWFLQHPAHFHPVIKGNTIALIDSAVKAQHKKIIEEDWKNLPKKLEITA